MVVPFLDLQKNYQSVKPEIQREINEVLDSAGYVLGPKVEQFEREFAKSHRVMHCVGVSSGTDGNHLALWALGVKHGDEVIVPANTYIATAWGATLCGAKPVFVDCDARSYNIDPAKVEEKITPRTKAVVAVHLYGQAADMDPLLEIGRRRGIPIVEDAAQAHLTEYKGKKVGGLGPIASFSFYPGKNLGAYGEGGAVTTNDAELASKVRKLRDHGQAAKYQHVEYGHNYRMEALQGAVLGVKLRYLAGWNEQRRHVAARYNELLKGVGDLVLPQEMSYGKHVYHLYVIQVTKRDELQKYLGEKGVATGLHYPIPVHLQSCFASLGHRRGDFPISETLSDRCLSLPMFPEMTEDQVHYVADSIKSFYR
jgi:dTDP-4-amino-4,6-dideoxygalactose transaminase